MNINKIISNTHFKGYKNIISHSMTGPQKSFAFMTMELNNDMGANDLDTWHTIQKNLMYNREPSNYISFNNTEILSHNILCVNELLLNINETKNLTPNKEKILIKLYQLVASLTKRISNTDNHPVDNKVYLSLIEAIKFITPILGDKKLAEIYTTKVATEPVKHYKTAAYINSKVVKDMAKYFKTTL